MLCTHTDCLEKSDSTYVGQVNEQVHHFVAQDSLLIVKHFNEIGGQALQVRFLAEVFAVQKHEAQQSKANAHDL